MRGCVLIACAVCVLIGPLGGCEDDPDPGAAVKVRISDEALDLGEIDKRPKRGREFLYLDDFGNVIRTARYEDIPPARRAAVIVVDGFKRAVARPRGEGYEAEALPTRGAPDAGAKDLQKALRQDLLELQRERDR
ncbi:MAG: hypothetical protein JXR96_12035 [Deltaproteobacteria bacterium]|nr:hypothetical protein [Deltaproteobacteria bacterium]